MAFVSIASASVLAGASAGPRSAPGSPRSRVCRAIARKAPRGSTASAIASPLGLRPEDTIFGLVERTRWLDARWMAALDGGVRQFVILGAGLDARAWRLPRLSATCRVFELDVPAAIAYKEAAVPRAFVAMMSALLAILGRPQKAYTSWEAIKRELTRELVDEMLELDIDALSDDEQRARWAASQGASARV